MEVLQVPDKIKEWVAVHAETMCMFANSPESKGKIERLHVVWQDRLPAYFERDEGMAVSPYRWYAVGGVG